MHGSSSLITRFSKDAITCSHQISDENYTSTVQAVSLDPFLFSEFNENVSPVSKISALALTGMQCLLLVFVIRVAMGARPTYNGMSKNMTNTAYL